MTNEEAIKVLRTESVELGSSATSVCRFWEALDMAVKALEDVTDKNVEKMTNADRIRAMSDEEMAEFIISIPMCVGEDKDLNCEIDVCKECFLKWLQQPAEEDKHD